MNPIVGVYQHVGFNHVHTNFMNVIHPRVESL
ncbi:hypothetical protein SAMN05216378_5540 [Paenibacillus catalpae]|uniref:Uncharacterized protein n=1 Tax=Paenibacillus catalpae TaxID=1045775 RepID=A0A1I2GXL6_9BACL|nr:hypothetical protein SAMN05216378_5540 [Paenibacillus catalpae]